jgi:septal ring factor EnvC (AmiA/AmiB activator)
MIKLRFKKCNAHKLTRLMPLISLALLIVTCFNSASFAEDLNDVQRQLKVNQQTQQQKQQQLKKLEQQLADSDQAIAKSSRQAAQTKTKISEQRAQLLSLQKQTEQLEVEKKKQQSLLEQQLTSAYMAGQNDLIKLILNQEDLSKVVRAKSYYHYLNEARLNSIEQLNTTQQKLEENQKQQAETLAALRETYQQQKKIESKVRAEKAIRDKALQTLNKDINYRNSKIAQLNALEKKLKDRIQQAAKARAIAQAKQKAAAEKARKAQQQAIAEEREQQAINAQINETTNNRAKFSTLKRKLKWPIRGKVLNRFGTTRSSQVKWKGITLSAREGQQVLAVAAGRVLYAGYFKGYGMVIAIDHGHNYITLYGYNQTLLQEAGDTVKQGEAIALAGKSGGQTRSSVYFELNHKGKAQNPLNWLSKKPW